MNIGIFKRSYVYLLGSFLALILAGAFLLALPMCQARNGVSFVDALFTSTSAVCVTGLTVVNTSEFNLLGQMVVLSLIQLGGLGIMTLTSSIILFIRGQMNLDEQLLLSNVNSVFSVHEMEKVLYTIVIYTAVVELAGAACLFPAYFLDGRFGFLHSAYLALFHSISAFCNAGFSTFDENLVGCGPYVKMVIAFLIIMGGLGYYVIYDLWRHVFHGNSLKIHSKLVIYVTLILIFGGTLALWVTENGGIPWIDAYFQSVSARTAGYNTVDVAKMEQDSKLVLIILMVIGACPGSTGGGVKTSTAALVFLSVYYIFRGSNKVYLFKRHVNENNILHAYAIVAIYVAVMIFNTMLILTIDSVDLTEALFEVASAIGTVGLSAGYSAKAGLCGKLILIATMYLGRVGPFTILIFLISKEKKRKLNYPEENLILG